MEAPYTSERQGASGQGAQWIFGSSKFSDEDHARIQEALNTALSWDQINSRQGCGGKKVHYLAGHTVVENANKIFGFDGWDSSILHLSVDYVEKTSDGKWTAAATAIVRVALKNGVGHEDVGNAHLKDRDKGEVLERAKKAAVTDATKRALRLFGDHLGGNMSNKEGLKDVERNHKQDQRALKARQGHESAGRSAHASPRQQLQPQQKQNSYPLQKSHHEQQQGLQHQHQQPIRASKVETSREGREAGHRTPPVLVGPDCVQTEPGSRMNHDARQLPPRQPFPLQSRQKPQSPRQQQHQNQQQQQQRHQEQPQGAANPCGVPPENPRNPATSSSVLGAVSCVSNSSPRLQPRGSSGDQLAHSGVSKPVSSETTPATFGRTLRESSPNVGFPTAAIDGVGPWESPVDGRGSGSGSGSLSSGNPGGAGGVGEGPIFLHSNSPVFEYSVGGGRTGSSSATTPATRPVGSASGRAAAGTVAGKGMEDDFGLSQDYASAFLEIDSAIQRHTTSLSSGSCQSAGSAVGTKIGNDKMPPRRQSSGAGEGYGGEGGGGHVVGERSRGRTIQQGQLAGNKRFREQSSRERA
ncbi:unnamed protein product [Ascophyllum nodosum]